MVDEWAEVTAGLAGLAGSPRQGSIDETVSVQAQPYLAHGGGCPWQWSDVDTIRHGMA